MRVYEAACTVLTAPEDFRRLTYAVLQQSAAEGVVYSETFLSPDFCGGGDLGAWREYLDAIKMGAAEAERDFGIILRGIVTCIRHFGPEQAKTAARCAAETADDWLTGFGIAGDELRGAPKDFAWSFDAAREAGLALTAHAGEWGGAASVADVIRDLDVVRVGHGVQAITDAVLVADLAARGIVLEVCPGSNVTLGVVPDWKSHPIQRLRDAGVGVTVSTDDPPFFHTTLSQEYDMLAETFGWETADFAAVNTTALNAAFCDDATRAAVKTRLEQSYGPESYGPE